MSAPTRMQRRDRPWVDANVTILCGPFEMPTLDALRQAVADVAAKFPESRLTWGLADDRQHWLLDRPVESVVVERDWDDAPHFAEAIDAIAADESLAPPLTLVRYPNYLGMKMAHCLGDGLIFVSVIAAALLTAINDDVVPWPTVPAGRLPLLRAALGTFGRNPGRVVSVIRDRYRAEATNCESNVMPWKPSRRSIYFALPADQTEEVYAWGRSHAPTASKFGIQSTLFLRALHQAGLEISDDVRVMMDLRSYLGSRLIDGNFFAGVPAHLSARITPEEISATVRAIKSSGRPLANQVMTTLRVGSAPPMSTSFDANALPQVTLSFLGAPPQVDWLPYLAGRQAVYAASVEPGGPHGVTLVHGHCAGQMIFNTCFHDNVVDAAVLSGASRLIADDPIGLLSQTMGVH